ncbi:putative DNA binding domain-containing protein [candidate division KSB1 bacterium]|nr:putative DNA binding domain-containing protein [candidate division KSB1 bacterium]
MTPREVYDATDFEAIRAFLKSPNLEGRCFERKEHRQPEALAQTVSAFANSNPEGGLLIIGITDRDLKIVGVNRPSGTAATPINKMLRYPEYLVENPSEYRLISLTDDEGHSNQMLLIYVNFSPRRVIELTNRAAYERRGDQTILLRDEEKNELRFTKGQKSFEDECAAPYESVLLAEEPLQQWTRAIIARNNLQFPHTSRDLLINKHLVVEAGGKLHWSYAGVLLFAADPKKYLPGAYVRFLRYDGKVEQYGTQQNLVKDETFAGALPLLLERVRSFVRTQVREFSYLGPEGRFVEEAEYPEFVWDEAIVNALVHRSYSFQNVPIFIKMFDDHLEVISPGDYPLGVRPGYFIHNPRNPNLMEVMRSLQHVKMAQEGTRRMFQLMHEAGLPEPEYSPPGLPTVKVVLRNDIERKRKR